MKVLVIYSFLSFLVLLVTYVFEFTLILRLRKELAGVGDEEFRVLVRKNSLPEVSNLVRQYKICNYVKFIVGVPLIAVYLKLILFR